MSSEPIYTGYPKWPVPIEWGNMILESRPQVRTSTANGITKINANGKDFSTLITATINLREKGKKIQINLPLLSTNGRKIYTQVEALAQYKKDGFHLGKFTLDKINYHKRSDPKGTTPLHYVAAVYAELLSISEGKKITAQLVRLKTAFNAKDYSISESPSVEDVLNIFNISGLPDTEQRTVAGRLISLSVSYDWGQSSQIALSFYDPDYTMIENRYFDVRRDVTYRGLKYEIGSVTSGPGQGGSPVVNIQCWPKSVQLMKRDKRPQNIAGTNGYDYAKAIARAMNLGFAGRKSGKQQALVKASNSTTDESVWNVFTSSGTENAYIAFECDGQLIYGSQSWMLWKFGLSSKISPKGVPQKYIDLRYDPNKPNNGAIPAHMVEEPFFLYDDALLPGGGNPIIPTIIQTPVPDNGVFELTTWPNVEYSENNALQGNGSASVASPNGKLLRPGYTVYLTSVPPFFRGGYLVSSVSFDEFNNQPVQIQFQTPEKPKDQQKPVTE